VALRFVALRFVALRFVALRFVALRFVALRLAAILLLLVKVIPAKADGLRLNGDHRRSVTASLRCSQSHIQSRASHVSSLHCLGDGGEMKVPNHQRWDSDRQAGATRL